MSPSDGISVLGFVTSSDIYYFSGDIPSHLLLEDIPSEEKISVPPNIQKNAQILIQSLGLGKERNIKKILDSLILYFSTFECGAIPDEKTQPDPYLAIALSKQGACRHRAFAFFVTANAIGIPTHFVGNDCHAFVEVFIPEKGWRRINLGGCGVYHLINPDNLLPYTANDNLGPKISLSQTTLSRPVYQQHRRPHRLLQPRLRLPPPGQIIKVDIHPVR